MEPIGLLQLLDREAVAMGDAGERLARANLVLSARSGGLASRLSSGAAGAGFGLCLLLTGFFARALLPTCGGLLVRSLKVDAQLGGDDGLTEAIELEDGGQGKAYRGVVAGDDTATILGVEGGDRLAIQPRELGDAVEGHTVRRHVVVGS